MNIFSKRNTLLLSLSFFTAFTPIFSQDTVEIYLVTQQNQKPSISERLVNAISSVCTSIVRTANNHPYLTSLAATIYLRHKTGFSVFGPLVDSYILTPFMLDLTGHLESALFNKSNQV